MSFGADDSTFTNFIKDEKGKNSPATMSLVKTDLKQIYEFYICEVSYSKEARGGEGIRENLTAVGKQIRSVEFPILFWANVN